MGPLYFTATTADFLEWAHYFFRRYHRCTWMGPLCILLPLLPISSNGPIISLGGTVDLFRWAYCILLLLLPIYLNRPIISSGGSIDPLGWAHYILLLVLPIYSLGPIISQEALSINSDGLIVIYCCCCQFSHLGLFFLQDIASMH